MDESGFSLIPHIAKTWAPIGKTPVVKHKFNWTKLSAISGISSKGKLYFQVYNGSIDSLRVIRFLMHLLRHIRRYIILIWDNNPTHHSGVVKAFLQQYKRLTVEYLPPYANELNPDEFIWAEVKTHELANFCPKNTIELKRGIRLAVMRIRNKPKTIKSFIATLNEMSMYLCRH